jgi:uncharacterized membrane protein YfcA
VRVLALPFAVAGAVRLRRRSVLLLPLLLFLAAVALVVGVTFGSVQYRAPAEVPIVVLAAVGVDALWDRPRSRDVRARRSAATNMLRVPTAEHDRSGETS